jgi:hypothetical protein
MLSLIDAEEKIQAFLPILEQMVQEGLVVLSDVDVIKYAYRPLELSQTEEQATAKSQGE